MQRAMSRVYLHTLCSMCYTTHYDKRPDLTISRQGLGITSNKCSNTSVFPYLPSLHPRKALPRISRGVERPHLEDQTGLGGAAAVTALEHTEVTPALAT